MPDRVVNVSGNIIEGDPPDFIQSPYPIINYSHIDEYYHNKGLAGSTFITSINLLSNTNLTLNETADYPGNNEIAVLFIF